MATERYFICVECHRRAYKARLFQTLRELSRGMTTCEACGGTMALHLVFKFGLDAGGADCKVLDVFLPADKDLDAWKREDGKWVTFFPFLVVMEYTDKRGQAFWLSYWHTVEGDASKQTKYGQWAPFLNGYLLKSLLAQARGKGYLLEYDNSGHRLPSPAPCGFLRGCANFKRFDGRPRFHPSSRIMIRAYQGHSPRIAETAYVAESAVIIGRVEIGENASVWFGAVLRGDIDPIRVGANSNVQDGCILHTMAGSPTIVGDWVTVGHRAVLHGCRVEDHCLIGMAAVLLNDVVVGEGSIVAAGAVVAERTAIPPRSLYLGVPARLHRALKETDRAFIDMHATHYLEYKETYLNEVKKQSPADAR